MEVRRRFYAPGGEDDGAGILNYDNAAAALAVPQSDHFTRNDFGKPEHVIAEQTIDAKALANIKQEIKNLPPGLMGKRFSKEGVHDGVLFRISFSSSGALTPERIEFENMHLPDLAPLLEAINAQLPADDQIHYQKTIGSRVKERTTKVEIVDVP
jgi:hypothetical protein